MKVMKKTFRYNIILRSEPEGGFTVIVPSLSGCITWGKDLPEAKKMASDAISGYIASLKKHGEPIPTDSESFTAYIEVPLRKGVRPPRLVHA